MARKFGKKNIVNLDPLAYNTMLHCLVEILFILAIETMYISSFKP